MPRRTDFIRGALLVALALAPAGQGAAQAPDRVLVRTLDRGPEGLLPWDEGAVGLRQRLLKLTNTASVLYTSGHPDDEQAGVLTLLGRVEGVRTALLTLNRGEGGANAIGPELFDGLGLIRSEELRLSGRYYGLDDQYFTTAADYGYSKTLGEAMRSWDPEALLEDMVRIIRLNRPLIVLSRWHGSARDGHGHHQATGVLTPLAVEAAADPTRFPEQIAREGLRPWRVKAVYRGRLLEGEPWHVELDPGRHDAWLGRSPQELGSFGLSLQRSQTSGRMRSAGGAAPTRFEWVGGSEPAPMEQGSAFFGRYDTSLPGLFERVGEEPVAEASEGLAAAEAAIRRALAAFTPGDFSGVPAPLFEAQGHLARARAAVSADSDVAFEIDVKLAQIGHAIRLATGASVTANAVPSGTAPGTPLPPLHPGDSAQVVLAVVNEGTRPFSIAAPRLADRRRPAFDGEGPSFEVAPGEVHRTMLTLRIPADADPTRPWFARESIAENVYSVTDSTALHLGESAPERYVRFTLATAAGDVPVTIPVRRTVSRLPFGNVEDPLVIEPAVSVRLEPGVRLFRAGEAVTRRYEVEVDGGEVGGAEVRLEAPEGWVVRPAVQSLPSSSDGSVRVAFDVEAPAGFRGVTRLGAVVRAGDREYREGFETIVHRDLAEMRLYSGAAAVASVVDVRSAPGVRVGYVMGVGDDVPAAIAEVGAAVTLLGDDHLLEGDLDFDAIVVGTRAYAVRPALEAANARLLDFMAEGGHLVVLYQTPEYAPDRLAPYPATLPRSAEEVSEEDAEVTFLTSSHPLLTSPNRLGPEDFAGWIEQRGSKFFAEWSEEYVPLVAMNDTGQPPQRGVWLTAPVGAGQYTYVALALHRQLLYGIPGAYRILANLLSFGVER